MRHSAVVDFSSYMREVCTWFVEKMSVGEIGGDGCIVEIDESLFSKRKANKGRMFPQQWVFGGICRETKDVFSRSVRDIFSKTLLSCIKKFVKPKTMFYSDCWAAYKALGGHPSIFHAEVNHSKIFKNPYIGVNTNNIECLWRDAKMKNKKMYGTNREMIESYLCEFLWRNYIKKKKLEHFESLLMQIRDYNDTVLSKL